MKRNMPAFGKGTCIALCAVSGSARAEAAAAPKQTDALIQSLPVIAIVLLIVVLLCLLVRSREKHSARLLQQDIRAEGSITEIKYIWFVRLRNAGRSAHPYILRAEFEWQGRKYTVKRWYMSPPPYAPGDSIPVHVDAQNPARSAILN